MVQYFDKSCMEITNPTGDPSSTWYVTNGLLVNELMTGKLQLGDSTFEQHQPAQVNVAGDADDASGPTYATFSTLQKTAPLAEGSVITQRVDRAGTVNFDPSFAGQNVTAARFVPETNHTVTYGRSASSRMALIFLNLYSIDPRVRPGVCFWTRRLTSAFTYGRPTRSQWSMSR